MEVDLGHDDSPLSVSEGLWAKLNKTLVIGDAHLMPTVTYMHLDLLTSTPDFCVGTLVTIYHKG